ncbi:uncharacterized protein LOC114758009 [Neltuma alba]|uniref:uncharacterized protein LOC114758009 n=1 Tax=Neltuma alba TaxID=207710 RepID=UPI0010A56ED8|nr:uncharacterized protein LOC114758009 [Prosopis alba]
MFTGEQRMSAKEGNASVVAIIIETGMIGQSMCFNIVQYAHCYTTLDLICMPFCDIDIVLGLNWLSSQNILLDCKSKTLILPTRELTPTAEVKLNMILAARADKWLRQGCQGYMVFFLVKAETEEGILNILVVWEFLEVFSTEISRLPLKREIEFAIDLVPGTNAISKALYWMALNEMVELKNQLTKLLEKGFIHPSVCP